MRLDKNSLSEFKHIWAIDFEYSQSEGNKPEVRCFCAEEYLTGEQVRLWGEDLSSPPEFLYKADSLITAYYGLAEMSCFHALRWPIPEYFVDLYVEFVNQTNGLTLENGRGLLGALKFLNISGIDDSEKTEMRDLALRGGTYSEEEKVLLLNYCMSDVVALNRILDTNFLPEEFAHCLLRGAYIKALSHVEKNGVPIDIVNFKAIKENWDGIRKTLILEIDKDFGVFSGEVFKRDLFETWLIKNDLSWPRLATGNLDLKDDTFKDMAIIYPEVAPLRDLRTILSKMRTIEVAVGEDGRNRCMLSPFKSKTGRNQPSTTKFIFGPSSWVRNLIKPEQGKALAYIDWSQQEFGIAAALAGDEKMKLAYESGDPYLAFAKQAGAAPIDATKQSHKEVRDVFKQCVLAVQYGMGEENLAIRISKPVDYAKELLHLHRKTYSQFWKWSDETLDFASTYGYLQTVFGWRIQLPSDMNARSARNFPMQANGAEMLRLACILLTEEGIKICATVHDALLIESDIEIIEETVLTAKEIMAQASAEILDGFTLGSDTKIIKYPDRFSGERGENIWNLISEYLVKQKTCSDMIQPVGIGNTGSCHI